MARIQEEKTNRWNEIQAVILFAIVILMFISLASFDFADLSIFTSRINAPARNFAGLVGAYLGAALFFVMGMSAYVMPLLVLSWAIARFYGVTPQKLYFKAFGTFFLILASSAMFSIIAVGDNAYRFRLGGMLGLIFSDFLIKYLGYAGSMVVIGVLFLLSVLLATEFLLLPFLSGIFNRVRNISEDVVERMPKPKESTRVAVKRPVTANVKTEDRSNGSLKTEKPKLPDKPVKINIPDMKKEPVAPPKPGVKTNLPAPVTNAAVINKPQVITPAKEPAAARKAPPELSEYKLPSINLLQSPPVSDTRVAKEDFSANAATLEETLASFGIEAKVIEISQGPVVTLYELEPAPGVRVQSVMSLSDNIALAMKAVSVRIIAPVPGKGTIGVEVPNAKASLVYLKEIVASKEYAEHTGKLKLALGKDIAGKPVIADLAKMPHLLIAGTTGSGKSVCINAVLTSLLLSYSPDELKFIMVDPKKVELSNFNGLPHLLAPVVTDSKKAAAVLEWVIGEMSNRFELLAAAGTKNIEIYNEKASKGTEPKLPYMIIVLDELADLMVVAQAEVEGVIQRITQLARAVGIHMIIATQRPSVDVITGVIKANLPARIAFKVASKVDSRTILDDNGADKLLGKGDMLFIEPGSEKPMRAQCSLIGEKEIEAITDFIKSQREPNYIAELVEVDSKRGSFKKFDKDEVYEEAVRMILESRQASVSVLQRRLGLGYTRAARLIDMMEDEGIVGPYQGSKPRDLLTTLEEYQSRSGTAESPADTSK
jgi:S-DNA-T family DNA segregation ATPase FtsK/SpoIIIE